MNVARSPASSRLVRLVASGALLLPTALPQEAAPPTAAAPTAAPVDGTLIVLNKAEASASLIDLVTGREAARVATGVGPHEVVVSPDGRLAVVADYGDQQVAGSTLTLFEIASARFVKRIDLAPHRRPHGIQWLGEESRVAVTSESSKALLLVDLEAGKVDAVVKTAQEASHMVALAPDLSRAYTANVGSGSVSVLDLVAERSIADVVTGAGCEGIDVTPDGAFVWTANRAADTVSVIDAASLAVVATLPCPSFPIRAKATPDGAHVLVSCARSGDVALFDARARTLVTRVATSLERPRASGDATTLGDDFAGSSVPIGILIHPAGRLAYVAHGNADLVSILDLSTREQIGTLATGKGPDGLGWSPLSVASKTGGADAAGGAR